MMSQIDLTYLQNANQQPTGRNCCGFKDVIVTWSVRLRNVLVVKPYCICVSKVSLK